MKRLLIVTSTFPSGENDIVSARFVYDLAQNLSDHYEVHVLSPHSNGAKSEEVMGRVMVHRFVYCWPHRFELLSSGGGMIGDAKKNHLAFCLLPFFLISQFLSAFKIIRKYDVKIVNSHWIFPQGLILAILVKPLEVIHVVTVHAAGIFLLKRLGWAGKSLGRFIARRTDCFLPVSSYIDKEVKGVTGANNSVIIPMGVDVDKFRFSDNKRDLRLKIGIDDKFTFLFVGKLSQKKGIPVLLKASKLLKERNLDFRVVIVGSGGMKEEIEGMIIDYGLQNEVKLYGQVCNDSLPDFYSASDVTVIPSVFDKNGETEGMPVVLNEAHSAGIPVIGSNISGIPDFLIEGENGWIFEPGDSKGLSDKMFYAMNYDINKKMSSTIRLFSEKRSWKKIAGRYFQAISRIEMQSKENGDGWRNKISIDINGIFKIGIFSKFNSYIKYFRDEFPSSFSAGNKYEHTDVNVYIDTGIPNIKNNDIVIERVFKGVYPYKCIIRGVDVNKTEVWFKAPFWSNFLWPTMSAVFLQTEIIEPLIYYKALKRGIVMLHACGVYDEKGGYILGARSGTGKTTASFHLVQKGYGFLGDDLIFLSKEGEIYSYPKRIHFFSYLKKKNTFLKVSKKIMVFAEARSFVRKVVSKLLNKNFYFSTRINIMDFIPGTKITDKVSARAIFFMTRGLESIKDLPEDEKYRSIIDTCDTRESLISGILSLTPDGKNKLLEMESDIVRCMTGNFKVKEILVEDIVKDMPLIEQVISEV